MTAEYMLLPTHYQLLLLAIKNNPKFSTNETNLLYNNKIIESVNLEKLITGLFYPDLPCAYFFINNDITMKLRLCSVVKLASLGKGVEDNIRSQLEESHNGRYSINHSMGDHPDKINKDVRSAILARCITVFYIFLTTGDFTFLGYLIHIIHDSFSPVHTYRGTKEVLANQQYDMNSILKSAADVPQITPYVDFDKITHATVSDIVYHVIDDKANIKAVFDTIKTMTVTSENANLCPLINKIIELMLTKCNTAENMVKVTNILLGYDDGNISNKVLNSIGIFVGKMLHTNTGLVKEKVSVDKINKNILNGSKIDPALLTQNLSNVLVGNVVYDSLSHALRRVYKLLMNSLITTQTLNKFSELSGGGCDIKRLYITSFLYYQDQDQSKHAVKDCGYIGIEEYKSLFYYAMIDTMNICNIALKALFDGQEIKSAIVNLYSYLINNTFNMDEQTLPEKISKINNDAKMFSKTDPRFLKCMKENLALAANSFVIKNTKVITDLNSKEIKKIHSELCGQTGGNAKFRYKLLKLFNQS